MRSWALAGIFVCVGALASMTGCDGGTDTGGDGGGGGGSQACADINPAAPDDCSGVCTNLQTDVTNCGACGTACDTAGGEVCNAGVCEVVVTGCDLPAGSMPDPVACGDTMSGCIACALGGDCADELATCSNDASCVAYNMCTSMCMAGDAACFDACAMAEPTGAMLFDNLALCVICGQCPVACDGPGSMCP